MSRTYQVWHLVFLAMKAKKAPEWQLVNIIQKSRWTKKRVKNSGKEESISEKEQVIQSQKSIYLDQWIMHNKAKKIPTQYKKIWHPL